MLTQIRIKDFKSYSDATLKLSPLTVLIGANASGKSNALEALRLLSWIAQGNKLSSIRYAVYEGEAAVRGTTSTLPRRGKSTFTIEATVDNLRWDIFSISLKRTSDDELHIVDEKVTSPTSTVPLYAVVAGQEGPGNDLRVAYDNFARGGRKPQVVCNDQMAVLIQMQSSLRFEAGHRASQTHIPATCETYQKLLSDIIFLDPQPSLMRRYSFKSEQKLMGDGSNISGVLWNLCQTDHGERAVLDLVRSLPEQNIKGIRFIVTPRGEAMVELVENFEPQEESFDATLLSDGTLCVLSIAAAVLTAPEGSLVVIEEIDNGVHPSRAGMILESLSHIAKRRRLSVIISSHNPALLDALPNDAVPNVVFCYRNPTRGTSQLVRLQDVPDYPQLVAQGTVGHLMTAGLIERFVKTHPGPEARRQKSRAWLKSLRTTAAE